MPLRVASSARLAERATGCRSAGRPGVTHREAPKAMFILWTRANLDSVTHARQTGAESGRV